MSGTFNLSLVFWIWLISFFILGLKVNNASGCGSSFETETEPGRLKVPALGRIFYGIGSLYDGRTGTFLPLEFSVLSGKRCRQLNRKVVNSTKVFSSRGYKKSFDTPSQKVDAVLKNESGNKNGLALRAVLGMLEIPENGSAGFLLDKMGQEEMTDINSEHIMFSSCTEQFHDELILPGVGTGKEPNPQDFDIDVLTEIVRLEIQRNLENMDIKILKRATHVVVKVIRGSSLVVDLGVQGRNSTNMTLAIFDPVSSFNSTRVTSIRVFSDDPASTFNSSYDPASIFANQSMKDQLSHQLSKGAVFPSTPEGVPLSFELMPLLQFLNESGLNLTSSSQMKSQFQNLQNSSWRDPMLIDHSTTFKTLDWSWQFIRQMARLNSTFHECFKQGGNQGKDGTKKGEMTQDLQNMYDNFVQKLTNYKKDLKTLLENSSSGTEQDQKLWDSIYLKKDDGAVGTRN